MVLLSVLITWVAVEVGGARPMLLDFERDDWQGTPSLTFQHEVRGLVVQFAGEGKLYATRSDQLFVSGSAGRSWSKLGQLAPRDYGRAESWGSRLRGTRVGRALWPGPAPKAVLVLADGSLLASHPPWIQRSIDGGRTWRRRHRIPGPPASVGLHGLAEEPTGRIWALPGEGDVHLLRSDDGGRKWEGVSLVPAMGPVEAVVPGVVTSVRVDPVGGRVWLTTAGAGEQTQIGWLEGDGTFRAIAVGKPEFAAGSLMFSSDAVSWASDSEEGPYGIWRWARDTEQITQVAELPGPARFSTTLGDGRALVATRAAGPHSTSLELWGTDAESGWASLLRVRLEGASGNASGATFVFPVGAGAPPEAGAAESPLLFSAWGLSGALPSLVLGEWGG